MRHRRFAIRAVLRVACLAACLTVSAAPGLHAESAALSLPQARNAAKAALTQHDYGLAIQLARALLQADPKDAQAYYLLALAHQQLGDTYLARRASAYAFRYSEHPRDRYATAQLAARTALRDKRFTLAQYWLRRSYDYTPDDRARQQAEADFRRLRIENPWSVQLGFSVDPSDNINGGAEDRINDIDGSPLVGLLSPSSRALSGLAINGRVNASYRLQRGADSETRLRFQGFTRRVILSDSARALLASDAPPVLPGSPPPPVPDNSDFSNSFASLGVSHSFRLGVRPGREAGNGIGTVALSFGRAWYGGHIYFNAIKAEAERDFTLPGGRVLSLGGELERRDYAGSAYSDSASLRFGYATPLANGARLRLGLNLSHTDAPDTSPNLRNANASAFATYEPAHNLGPARLKLVLGVSHALYADYRVGFFPVPGGRRDSGVSAAVSLAFDDFGFAGFAPELTLRGRRTQSNVGRFDTQEMTLSIGLKSNF